MSNEPEQRLIPGITPKQEQAVIDELDGILSSRDKIASYKEKLSAHKESARELLKEHGRPSVVHKGHVFKREKSETLSVNKLKKEGKPKGEKTEDAPEPKFTPKKADAAAAS